MLFASCMDANGGVFDVVLNKDATMIANRLVHASIIDGMKLCKAQLYNYKHPDMAHLMDRQSSFGKSICVFPIYIIKEDHLGQVEV